MIYSIFSCILIVLALIEMVVYPYKIGSDKGSYTYTGWLVNLVIYGMLISVCLNQLKLI